MCEPNITLGPLNNRVPTHSIAHMTAKMSCGAVMIWLNSKPHHTILHRTCDCKNKVRYNYDFN